MNRIGLIILFLFLSIPVCGRCSQQQNIEQKKEVTDPYLWDFGRVKEGVVLKHDFTLRNESKNILNIKDVNTSCGCTVSKVAKKRLLPKESTPIEVEFRTKGYSGPTQQYVYVYTDSLDNQIIRYIIKADIVR